ncbi:hypothetical protein PENTCL1PPCAC_24835, partial [Pristionchus entomophagus]
SFCPSGRPSTMSSSRSSSSRSTPRSKAKKPRMRFNSKNEANAILAILENRARNMGGEVKRLQRAEKTLARLNKSIEHRSDKMRERVRVAEEEMVGRLGFDPELRWSEVRRMKWGDELHDETSLSCTKSDRSRAAMTEEKELEARCTSTEASSLARTPKPKAKSPARIRCSEKKAAATAKKQAAKKPVDPAVSPYDEAIKHLDTVAAELRAISAHSIVEDEDTLKHAAAVKDLAEGLKAARDQLKE